MFVLSVFLIHWQIPIVQIELTQKKRFICITIINLVQLSIDCFKIIVQSNTPHLGSTYNRSVYATTPYKRVDSRTTLLNQQKWHQLKEDRRVPHMGK